MIKKMILIASLALPSFMGCAGVHYTETEYKGGEAVVVREFKYSRTGRQEIQGFKFYGDKDKKEVNLDSQSGDGGEIVKLLNSVMENAFEAGKLAATGGVPIP